MLEINDSLSIPDREIELRPIHAQGAGGQHVNKAATAIHLRFVIVDSSLPDHLKARLLALKDHRITDDGIVVIKAQESRSRSQNREIARSRLQQLVRSVLTEPKKRRRTKPSYSARQRRLEGKKRRGQIKELRRKITG